MIVVNTRESKKSQVPTRLHRIQDPSKAVGGAKATLATVVREPPDEKPREARAAASSESHVNEHSERLAEQAQLAQVFTYRVRLIPRLHDTYDAVSTFLLRVLNADPSTT